MADTPSAPSDVIVMALPESDPQLLAQIQSYHAKKLTANPIYAFLLAPVIFTHCSPGLVIARLRLQPCHMNSGGSLHGSVSATIADWIGGQAICSTFTAAQHATRKGGTGVSVEIAVSYLGTVKVGEVIEIEGKADKVGGSLGFTSMGIWRVEGGEEAGGEGDVTKGRRGRVVALGKHTKFVRERS